MDNICIHIPSDISEKTIDIVIKTKWAAGVLKHLYPSAIVLENSDNPPNTLNDFDLSIEGSLMAAIRMSGILSAMTYQDGGHDDPWTFTCWMSLLDDYFKVRSDGNNFTYAMEEHSVVEFQLAPALSAELTARLIVDMISRYKQHEPVNYQLVKHIGQFGYPFYGSLPIVFIGKAPSICNLKHECELIAFVETLAASPRLCCPFEFAELRCVWWDNDGSPKWLLYARIENEESKSQSQILFERIVKLEEYETSVLALADKEYSCALLDGAMSPRTILQHLNDIY